MTDEELIVDLNRLFWLLEEDRQYCSRTDTVKFAARRIEAQAAEIERLRGELAKHQETFQMYVDANEARIDAEAKLAKAVEALQSVMEACDQGRMTPHSGIGGMTIEANIKGSIYVGVPAWPIEEARTTLAELTGGKHENS